MKEFISQRLDSLTELANELKPVYRHGLSISTKPRSELRTVTKGTVSYNGGEFFEHQFAPDEFADLFTDNWFKNEDLLSTQTFIDIDTFVLAYAKGPITIKQTDSSLGLFLIVTGDTNITLETNGVGTTRVHVLAKKGNATFTHIQQGEHIVHKVGTVGGGSLKFTDILLTDSYVRSFVKNDLIKPEAKGEIKSFYITKGRGVCDIYTENNHVAQHTKSDIVTRGVVDDTAKTLSRGLVKIGQDAAHSAGYEQQDALLLSHEAEADAIPNLEIQNHDVKCSHGSTVGKVDAEKLFYLTSRGLSESKAKSLLIKGYFMPVIESIADRQIRESVLESVETALD